MEQTNNRFYELSAEEKELLEKSCEKIPTGKALDDIISNIRMGLSLVHKYKMSEAEMTTILKANISEIIDKHENKPKGRSGLKNKNRTAGLGGSVVFLDLSKKQMKMLNDMVKSGEATSINDAVIRKINESYEREFPEKGDNFCT